MHRQRRRMTQSTTRGVDKEGQHSPRKRKDGRPEVDPTLRLRTQPQHALPHSMSVKAPVCSSSRCRLRTLRNDADFRQADRPLARTLKPVTGHPQNGRGLHSIIGRTPIDTVIGKSITCRTATRPREGQQVLTLQTRRIRSTRAPACHSLLRLWERERMGYSLHPPRRARKLAPNLLATEDLRKDLRRVPCPRNSVGERARACHVGPLPLIHQYDF